MAEIEVGKDDPSIYGKFMLHIAGSIIYVENQGNQDPSCEVWAVVNGEPPVQIAEQSMTKFEGCESVTIHLVEDEDTIVVEMI